MLETGITPDFITVDGGEGGTGAAPTEMTNSVGTPLRDALIFVNRALIGIGLREPHSYHRFRQDFLGISLVEGCCPGG